MGCVAFSSMEERHNLEAVRNRNRQATSCTSVILCTGLFTVAGPSVESWASAVNLRKRRSGKTDSSQNTNKSRKHQPVQSVRQVRGLNRSSRRHEGRLRNGSVCGGRCRRWRKNKHCDITSAAPAEMQSSVAVRPRRPRTIRPLSSSHSSSNGPSFQSPLHPLHFPLFSDAHDLYTSFCLSQQANARK